MATTWPAGRTSWTPPFGTRKISPGSSLSRPTAASRSSWSD